MTNAAENLRTALDYFSVSNNDLARALDVDPSLVSRWLTGQRRIKASSATMDALAEFLLSRSRRVQDVEWFRAKFDAAGLPTGLSTVYQTKQNLILWLASDGAALRRNLGSTAGSGMASPKPVRIRAHAAAGSPVRIGCVEIALALGPELEALGQDSAVDIFLSSDEIATIVDEDVLRLMLHSVEACGLRIRLVVCVSGNTRAMSKLIDAYMQPLVSGRVSLSVVHGLTQTVTNQMHALIEDRCAVLVTETPAFGAPPVAAFVDEPTFVAEAKKSFEQAARYAQSVLNIYDDNYSRSILELLYREFCTPGPLDVVKDNINPLYMTQRAYERVLRSHGHSEEEYAWRCTEFARFKSGMDETLRAGESFREILSLARLNSIADEGFCRMPGLYFMKKGFVIVDAPSCAAILEGYIAYLEAIGNFQVLILDEISMLHTDNCWQLKQNHHLAINHWSGEEPVMIHSDQLLLLREFQAHFDGLWARGAGAVGGKAHVIAVLRDVLRRLRAKHGIQEKADETASFPERNGYQ